MLPSSWGIQHPVHSKRNRHRFIQILIILTTITFLLTFQLLTPRPRCQAPVTEKQ